MVSNIAKYLGFQRYDLLLAADNKFSSACGWLHEVLFVCVDSVHSPETLPARGHVFVQD